MMIHKCAWINSLLTYNHAEKVSLFTIMPHAVLHKLSNQSVHKVMFINNSKDTQNAITDCFKWMV